MLCLVCKSSLVNLKFICCKCFDQNLRLFASRLAPIGVAEGAKEYEKDYVQRIFRVQNSGNQKR